MSYKFLAPLAALLGVFTFTGCDGGAPDAKPASSLRCYVGGTMRPAMEEIARIYEQQSGQKIDIEYADSGELFIRVKTTGEGDLLVVHDPFQGRLMKEGLGHKGWTVAALTPMIAVPRGNPKEIRGLRDLARPGLRVAFTHPLYSTGGYIADLMAQKSGLREALERNLVDRPRQGGGAANAVVLGALDAAIVWDAVIAARKNELEAVDIEPDVRPVRGTDATTSATYGRIDMDYVKVTIAVLACSQNKPAAEKFAEFVASTSGAEVFANFGFSPVDPTREESAAEQRPTGTILIHCGAGLSRPITEIGEIFTRETGVRVECNFSGSQVILGQIELSGKGDIFIPGDDGYVEIAERKGLVREKRALCRLVPVIIVPKDGRRKINDVTDLMDKGVRLGIGDPEAAAIGKNTIEIFGRLGIERNALLGHAVLTTPTVNQLADAVKLGSIDAAIVWDSIAVQYATDCVAVEIPADLNRVSRVVGATIAKSPNHDGALAFVEFAASARGREIFAKHGYATDHGNE